MLHGHSGSENQGVGCHSAESVVFIIHVGDVGRYGSSVSGHLIDDGRSYLVLGGSVCNEIGRIHVKLTAEALNVENSLPLCLRGARFRFRIRCRCRCRRSLLLAALCATFCGSLGRVSGACSCCSCSCCNLALEIVILRGLCRVEITMLCSCSVHQLLLACDHLFNRHF